MGARPPNSVVAGLVPATENVDGRAFAAPSGFGRAGWTSPGLTTSR